MGLEKCRFLIIFVIFLATTTLAFHSIHPADKEIVYNWRALVRAGTHLPAHYASQFIIHGKMRMQSGTDSTLIKLDELQFNIYNGRLDHVEENRVEDMPMPKEMEDLHRPFKVVQDSNGLAVGIVTDKNEHEYTRNMKKAIATIVQLDNEVLKSAPHIGGNRGMVKKEHSIYGYGDVDYIIHEHDDHMSVHKLHDMHHTRHLYRHFFTNTEPLFCDVPYEKAVMHDSQKRYKIMTQEGMHLVKHIEANGAIFYYPFQARSDSQYILVNQTFDFMEMLPIQTPLLVENEHLENDLTFNPYELESGGALQDITHGRRKPDHKKLTELAMQTLEEIWQYLHEDHLHTKVPNAKHGESITRMFRILIQFPTDKMMELYTAVKSHQGPHREGMLKVFYQVLPMTGSHASALLIKKLVMMDNEVTAEQANHMLSRLPEYLHIPSKTFLIEMEPLMNIDNKLGWPVKKVGILTFGTLVHKSLMYEMKMHENDHFNDPLTMPDAKIFQQYEKYVVEYVKMAKESDDYKMRMIYLDGLFNMKMPSTVEHLKPALFGEWEIDRHLRMWVLGAMIPSLLSDPNPETVIKYLWPIFTNRQEHTEMRVMVYYYMMQARPSASRLSNMYWYMMSEPDVELYHYHYTYVKSMMETKEPCQQQMSLKMRQLMKFMQPPKYGSSTATLATYMSDFGYSGNFEGHMIVTNDSHIFTVGSNTNLFNSYNQDYMIYVKLHGVLPANMDPIQIVQEFLVSSKPKIPSPKQGMHIEIGYMRQQQVVDSWYFDANNMQDAAKVLSLDFFAKDGHSISQENLEIAYDRFHRAVIPTDLGFAALWIYRTPKVRYNNMTAEQKTQNSVTNTRMNTRYIVWSHGHDGLMLYNPVGDIWQGIFRYHAFDSALPINGEISINNEQKILQMSWKKHPEPLQNVAGIRRHVHQSTFILSGDSDFHQQLMKKSMSKSFSRVSLGEKYHHKYVVMDKDDMNTGHKWFMAAYDSTMRFTNGSISSFFHNIVKPQLSRPSGNLLRKMELMAISVIEHYMKVFEYLPKGETFGVLTRMEPSQEHVSDNIDLSMRMKVERVGGDFEYAPDEKVSSRLTYAVKNQGQSLKTWDSHALLDVTQGGTVKKLKMAMTRMVPGQDNYQICLDGVKKWNDKGMSGHINMGMSQSPDGKCVRNDTVIDITMTGERSHEQEQEFHAYGACQYVVPYSKMNYNTMKCMVAHTTLRHYVYNVKTTNVPSEFKKMFGLIWDRIRGYFMSHYTVEDDHAIDMPEHNLKVDVMYPMEGHEVDVEVVTPHHIHQIAGVSTLGIMEGLGMRPESSVYRDSFLEKHERGVLDHCEVHIDRHVTNHRHEHREAVPFEWTLFVGDKMESPKKAVYVKQVEDQMMAFKIVDGANMVEIVPIGNKLQLIVDGEMILNQGQHHMEWMDYFTIMHGARHSAVVMLHRSGFHVEYDGHRVIIIVPDSMENPRGNCFDQ